MLNIHTSPLLAVDFHNGLREGVPLDETHFLLSYILQRKAPEVCIYYNSQLQWDRFFSFTPKILLIMNDLKATVILIGQKKHSNQMEAGLRALGEGLGRDLRFSLALSANLGGSWLGEALAPSSAQPRLRASGAVPRLLGCPPAS